MLDKIIQHLFLLLVGFCAAPYAWAQKPELVTIPDEKFRTYLKAKIPDAFTGDQMDIHSESVTTLSRINVLNKKVQSFQGIEYFVALEEFNCTYNLAATLDLSKNKKLKYLVCWENRLTALDLSANKELTVLNCGDNKIASLTLSGCKMLRELRCEYNALTTLNLSTNKNLRLLNCVNNNLTRLDITRNSNLEVLECAGNPITTVGRNAMLAEIPDRNFRLALKEIIPNAFAGEYLNTKHSNVVYLKILNVSSRTIASLKGIEYFTSLQTLDCHGNTLTTLDLSKNIALQNLNITGNTIASLDITGMRSISTISVFAENNTPGTLKVHANVRDSAWLMALKQRKGKTLRISVYGAEPGSTTYYLINANDNPVPLDNRYRNNS